MSEEALQIAEKRREAKSKGERERYTQLNAEFQTTARRDKKAFLCEQFIEIEQNNRMEKKLDFFQLFIKPPQTTILPSCISFSLG